MKKTVKKGLILLVIFLLALAGYFVWFFVRRDDRGTAYTSIEDADLPVACVELFGRRMNPMKGFVEDNPRAAGRADLTVLPEDLRLPVVFEEVNSTVSGIQYEIRSLDGERLVERTVLESWEQADREVRATLEIQNLLTKGEEYRLTLAIATGEHPAVYYYTRIVWTDAVQMAQMTDLACSFSEKSFDYAAARDLTTYLETNPDADNSSLGHVTLKNDFNQLTWRSLAIRPYGEVSVHLRELQGSMGCIDLEYVAAETGEDGTERFFDVTESFTMRQGAERIYMMNYDRRTNEIFSGDSDFFSGGRIMLGISDGENLQAVSDASGRYHAFVANRVLWCYDEEERESTKVFAFRKSEEDLRNQYNSHGVRILAVSETGEIDFLVYGYMSRGNHEGTSGVALYRYAAGENTLTERLYLPASEDYGSLRQDLGTLCYLSGGQTLYLLLDHAVYSVNLTSREYMVVAEGLTEENFAVSTDGSRIAWQEGADWYASEQLNVMDLESGQKNEIVPGGGETVRLVGFVGSDLVYGLAHAGELQTAGGRVTGPLLYAVEIVGSGMETETRYERDGIWLTEVTIEDSRVHMERVRKSGGGYVPADEDTLVCNEAVSVDPLEGIGYLTDSERGRQYFVQLDPAAQIKSFGVRVPRQAAAEERNEIRLEAGRPLEGRMYYAYSGMRMEGAFSGFADAVGAVYDSMGVVTDGYGRVFWSRAGRSDSSTVADVEGAAASVQHYLNEVAQGLQTSADGTLLVDARGLTLNQVLDFIFRGRPVAAWLGNGSYVVIYGYDIYNISCLWYPGTEFAYTDKMGLNDAAAFFEANGENDFIAFLGASGQT